MDDTQFWTLIEQSRVNVSDCDAQADRLCGLLMALPPEEIYAFDRHFATRRQEAYTWDLWGAAYLVNGGCSDDGFEYFRCWLIGQGRAAYEAALEDPESIGGLIEDDAEDVECESLMYAADHAYERVTGAAMPPTAMNGTAEPSGEPWTPDDLDRRFPVLCRRF